MRTVNRKGSPRKGSPKRVLRLPDLDHAKRTVLDSLGSPDSARAYAFAMNDFIACYCSEPDWLSASASSCGTGLSGSRGPFRIHDQPSPGGGEALGLRGR